MGGVEWYRGTHGYDHGHRFTGQTMTKRGQTKKRHHQVPQFVLEKFASPTIGKVWTYDKQADQAWPTSVEDTACERHLYSVTTEDGQHCTAIEDAIEKIETAAAPIYERILYGEMPMGEDRHSFSSFVAIMHVRTNAFRRLYAEIQGNLKLARDYMIASDDALFNSTMARFEADCGARTDAEKQRLRAVMLDSSDVILAYQREYTLKALGFHDDLTPLIASMEWMLMEAPTAGPEFITSDNPVVPWVAPQFLHPHRGSGGWKHRHVQVTFPLSPKLCWLGHWIKGMPTRWQASAEEVKQANRVRAAESERFLYSHVLRDGLRRLAEKYANSQRVIHAGPMPTDKKAEIRVVRSLEVARKRT